MGSHARSIALLLTLAGCAYDVEEADGVSEMLDGPSPVLVNECSVGSGGFIELYNPSRAIVDLSHDAAHCFYVDDAAGGGAPKRITDSVVSHAAGSTTCASAGRPVTCGLVTPGERVWVSYSYVNRASADECRLVIAEQAAGVCDTTQLYYGAGGVTSGTEAGQCFGRSPDGGEWQASAIACTPSGGSNGCDVGAACDDGDACTTEESLGADCSCGSGAPTTCDDTNACTADACDSVTGCTHTAIGCDDGDECTADACDRALGCTHEIAASCGGCESCDDGNACTSDACGAEGCASTPLADGTPCGSGSVCEAGACIVSSGPTIVDGAEDRVLLRGIVAGPTAAFAGEVLVVGTLITCVAPSCSSAPGAAGATVIETQGVIMPGLIDAHNHGLFDIFDESDWSPTRLYSNHNQWTTDPRYQDLVDAKQWLGGENTASPVDYRCEMDKWAELKALIAGTTSFLLAPGTTRSCYASLVRSIDVPQNDLGFDRIQTSISVPNETGAQSICGNYATDRTDAYVLHVGEGIDTTARNEFTTLASRAGGCLLAPETTIVHGTALGTPEFQTMAAHDMGLVWSPRSNDFLYGSTTRIDLAIAAGVRKIALAPDWSIGGSVNMLDELRYARGVDANELGGIIGTRRLFDMVTIDAARVLGLEAYVGSIEVGKRADLVVVPVTSADAYEAIFSARPGTMRLVMVDGRVLYGDEILAAAGPALPGCERTTIDGAPKFMCVAESSTLNFLDQTYDEIRMILVGALEEYDATFMTPETAFSPIAPLHR